MIRRPAGTATPAPTPDPQQLARAVRKVGMSAEVWLPVPGYEGRYEASDRGRVRSLRAQKRARKEPFILNPWTDRKNYLCIRFSGPDGAVKHCRVHQAVALAFLGPRPAGTQVRHLDGDNQNNQITNLAYGTPSENSHDMVAHGVHPQARKTHCPQGHPYVQRKAQRTCLECQRDRNRRRRAAARQATAALARAWAEGA